MAQTTNVVIQQSPLADFLNKVPELIFEAKAYGDQLKWKEEQAELDRKHEKDIKDLEFNRNFMAGLYTQNQELNQSIAELGIISTQAENLPEDEQTPGFDSVTDVISGQYKGNLNEVNNAISYLQDDTNKKLKTVASYNMGKNLFTQIDQNADGTIDQEEKAAYVDQYADMDLNFDAFSQGIYASELGAEQKVAIDLTREQLVEAKLRNQYLPADLEADASIKNKDIELKGADINIKNEQLKQMGQQYALNEIDIETSEINLEKLKQEIEINRTTFNNEQATYIKGSLVEQQARDKINSQTVASKLMTQIYLFEEDGETISSMYDIIVDQDGKVRDLDFEGLFQVGSDYHQIYEAFSDLYGDAASIEGEMLGLFKSIEVGWDDETGAMIATEPYLNAIDDIYTEVSQIEANNVLFTISGMNMYGTTADEGYDSTYDMLKDDFEEEYEAGALDNPKEFIIYVDTYLKDLDYELSELELIELARYMQYNQSGLTNEDLLATNRKLLDNINKADTLLEEISAQEADEYDRLK